MKLSRAEFDAILLDVDNGPDGLIHADNDQLYNVAGLRRAHAALKPGGVLAIWSAYPDAAFSKRLDQAGFLVEEVKVRATGGQMHLAEQHELVGFVISMAKLPVKLHRLLIAANCQLVMA